MAAGNKNNLVDPDDPDSLDTLMRFSFEKGLDPGGASGDSNALDNGQSPRVERPEDQPLTPFATRFVGDRSRSRSRAATVREHLIYQIVSTAPPDESFEQLSRYEPEPTTPLWPRRVMSRWPQACWAAGRGVLVAEIGAALWLGRRVQAGCGAGAGVLVAGIGAFGSMARRVQARCAAGAGVLVAEIGAFGSMPRRTQVGWAAGVCALVAAIAIFGLLRESRGSGSAVEFPVVLEPRAESTVVQPLTVPASVDSAVPLSPEPTATVARAVQTGGVTPPVIREQERTPAPTRTEKSNTRQPVATEVKNAKPLSSLVLNAESVPAGRRLQPSELTATRATAPAQEPVASSKDAFVGAITIDSYPVGAHVFLDGRLLGQTPVAASDMRAGSHVLRLDLDGYERWSAGVQVVTYKTVSVTARLQPVATRP